MEKKEILKQLGYSEDFVRSLKKYEDVKQGNANINPAPVKSFKLEFNSIDVTNYELNIRSNDATKSVIISNMI